ncbi:peptidylprolyl isomerase [bacterium]|nr:peptidylprolyl isomerase [bacterium]
MKKLFPVAVVIMLITILAGCGQKAPDMPFETGSERYEFFKMLSDSLDLEVMHPDKPVVLIESSGFNIWTYDIMPGLYAQLSRYKDNLKTLPMAQIKATIQRSASSEAEKKLLAAKVKKEGVVATDSTVDAQLEQFFQAQGGKDKFLKIIEAQGFSLDYVREDVSVQMSIRKYMNEHIEKELQITEDDLKAAYDQDKSASVRHILFETSGRSDEEKAEVIKKAESILVRARAGEDFAALAKEFTDDNGSKETGGLYEDFTRGKMVKAFNDASFNLPVGTISDLVETQFGYHIIKIINRKKETRPFEEVRAQMEMEMKQSRQRQAYIDLLEELKEQSKYKEHFDLIEC